MANYELNKTTKKGWTKQPNAMLRDQNLTSDAYKVISFLLSVTGDYNISIKGISKTINLSESKVKRAVALLQRNGYLKIEKVKLGKVFGCRWLISDAPGVYGECTGGHSMDARPMDGQSMYEKSIDGKSMDAPIYEYTDRYKQTNEKRIDEQPFEEEEESEKALSPFSSPNQSGEPVLSFEEVNTIQAFNRFCDVYPRLGDRDQARAAFFAIPDIHKICWQITNSVEWFQTIKRWDDWLTGQKNISVPQAAKFLKRGDWQEYMKAGSTKTRREELDEILPDEEDDL